MCFCSKQSVNTKFTKQIQQIIDQVEITFNRFVIVSNNGDRMFDSVKIQKDIEEADKKSQLQVNKIHGLFEVGNQISTVLVDNNNLKYIYLQLDFETHTYFMLDKKFVLIFITNNDTQWEQIDQQLQKILQKLNQAIELLDQ